MLSIIVYIAIPVFTAALATFMFWTPIKKAFARANAKPVKAVNADSTVVWKACPFPHTETSHGIDVTDKLVGLGANALPDGGKYAFFESIHIQNSNPLYEILSEEKRNILAIIWHPMSGEPIISTWRVDVLASDPESEMLVAADKVYSHFHKEHSLYLREQNFKAFLSGRPNAALPVIGEQSEWKDDN